MFDYIIVGAGFSGSVMAERIVSQLNKKVLIIEKRNHIGGNCYDYYNEHGHLVHKYGPHIFHTKLKQVWDYLSQFTEWNLYQHHVLGQLDGCNVPIPFNLNSLERIFPKLMAENLTQKLISKFGYGTKVPILKLREIDDEDLKMLAEYIYNKVFLNYTQKQWNLKPEELDPYVTGRVPIFISRDNRYFQDEYQGMPKQGYTKLFENMLNSKQIKVLLNTDYKELINIDFTTKDTYFMGQKFNGTIIYTGKIDELFDFCYGQLPYRSLEFKFETYEQEFYQASGTVNYPNDYSFTRITEMKYLTGQKHKTTTIVKEYPKPCELEDIPYYPIPQEKNIECYTKYVNLAKQYTSLILSGRLADYKYYDMHVAIFKALETFESKIR